MNKSKITSGIIVTKKELCEKYNQKVFILNDEDERSLILIFEDNNGKNDFVNLTNFLNNITKEDLKKERNKAIYDFLYEQHYYLLISANKNDL